MVWCWPCEVPHRLDVMFHDRICKRSGKNNAMTGSGRAGTLRKKYVIEDRQRLLECVLHLAPLFAFGILLPRFAYPERG